ncbi:MAG: DUF4116 domain-containing protein, partial [Candidatus Marinamargulisbacteria bacterium]|nr:DUF4116 domain-containing protein [Candidatus Marinamargulisbacteria bacterium]
MLSINKPNSLNKDRVQLMDRTQSEDSTKTATLPTGAVNGSNPFTRIQSEPSIQSDDSIQYPALTNEVNDAFKQIETDPWELMVNDAFKQIETDPWEVRNLGPDMLREVFLFAVSKDAMVCQFVPHSFLNNHRELALAAVKGNSNIL